MPRTTGRGPTRGPGAPSTHPGEAWGTACPHPAFPGRGAQLPCSCHLLCGVCHAAQSGHCRAGGWTRGDTGFLLGWISISFFLTSPSPSSRRVAPRGQRRRGSVSTFTTHRGESNPRGPGASAEKRRRRGHLRASRPSEDVSRGPGRGARKGACSVSTQHEGSARLDIVRRALLKES